MDQKSFWYAVVLVVFHLYFLSKMISAKILDFPLANLSASWINTPSNYLINDNVHGQSSISPVLYRRSSNGSQFMSGFYCPADYSRAPNCLFSILIFQDSFEKDNNLVIRDPSVVWSANRDRPVHANAILNLTKRGDLILKDADGGFVWSTNTGGKNVVFFKLTEMGNLVLQSENGTIVWQSFDHPTDVLLPSQIFLLGKSLTSVTSVSNISQGLYSLIHDEFGILSAYIESNPPQCYFSANFSPLYYNQYLTYDGEKGIMRYKARTSNTPEFMRLDYDGHLNVYVWDDVAPWKIVADMFAENIDECRYPLVCGKYGICSSGQCSCPDEANYQTNFFRPIDRWHQNLGCNSYTPISCSNPNSHTLLELKNTSYLNVAQRYGFTKLSKGEIKLEDCKNSCLGDCSCKAAFFLYDMVDGVYFPIDCLLMNEVFSLKNTDGYDNVLAFLKVEEPPDKQNSSTSSPRKSSSSKQIIVGASGALLGAISLFTFFFLLLRRKSETEDFDEISFNHVPWMPTRFSYGDLKAITKNFISKLGQGGFGSVFEGTLSDGTKVAVKRLDGLGHIKRSFLAEVETIGSIHHVNLVRLIGFCAEKSHRLLVYEYMPKGSLDKWIFQKNKELRLDWESRKKIILDIAKGLAYLHDDCRHKILHLDIKPHNILLDENLNAKVSDFGMAKLIDKDQSQVMTHLRGTPGYLAPEWLSLIITEKVDVYSFGIVVLEILCGRKNMDRSEPEEGMLLVTLFKRKLKEGSLSSSMSMVVKAIEDSLDVENSLGYDFANITTSATIAPGVNPEDAFGCTTLLPPISLSGPR